MNEELLEDYNRMKWYVDIGVLGGAMGKFRPGQGKCLVHVLGWHTLTKAIRRMQFIEFFTIGAVAYLICAGIILPFSG